MSPSQAATMGNSSPPPPKIIGNNYKVGAEVGRGSFANVYKGVDLTKRQPIAVKSVFRSLLKNKKLLENLEIEISILKDLKHPHIVKLLNHHQTEQHFHLIMEYCSLGDLSFFIRKKDQLIEKHPLIKTIFKKYPSPKVKGTNFNGLNKILVLNYLKQLSSALKFLRSKNLVHRDIKPQNLLLAPPAFDQEKFEAEGYIGLADLPILKIADFGFARFLPNTSLAETLCGSPLYMAPEILNYQKYTAKADLWSVGAVLYEMSVGKPPFRAANHLELFNKIKKAKDKIHFPSITNDIIDPQIKRLVCSLLKFEPTERMGFNEFFDDDVVNYDLTTLLNCIDQKIHLEPSQVNENLFISEYITKDGIINNNNLNIADDDGAEEEQESQLKPSIDKKPIQAVKQISQNDIQPILQPQSPFNSLRNLPSPSTAVLTVGDSQQLIQQPSQHETKPNTKLQSGGNKSPDIVVEKEYVVVEKTVVEVNALADELANAGTGAGAIALPNYNYHQQQRHRPSRTSSGSSVGYSRRPSFDQYGRRIFISISPTNALSKALGLASSRLFGNSDNGGQTGGNTLVKTQNTNLVNTNSSFTNNIILNSTNQQILNPSTKSGKEDDIIFKLENLATKSHVINLFAEVKFSQLIPSPSSNSYAIEDDEDDLTGHIEGDNSLPPELTKTLSDEAVLLYVKTLSLLAKAMNIASEWWHANNNLQFQDQQRLNEIVQWIRERFNEALAKAEFVKLKLQDAEKKLYAKNPNFQVNFEKIYFERLIYDRALEIAKNTAKVEMSSNENLLGCELAYSTSIWMLEALLDQDQENSSENLDEGDKEMVNKYIKSISNRLNALKKKIDGLK